MPKPVSESLVVHWRTTVEYHLHRLDLLTETKDMGSLEQFLVTPERIGVRTDAAQLTMDEDEVSIHPKGNLSDDTALDLLRLAFRCALPPKYHYFVGFQFLIPLADQSYDTARRTGLAKMGLGSVNAHDFALMMDGLSAGAEWHCEFGIVSEDEVEGRLRRSVGRTGNTVGGLPLYVPTPTDLAPVSFFADLLWQIPPRTGRGIESVDDIAGHVSDLRQEAERIISGLHDHICERSLQASGGSES